MHLIIAYIRPERLYDVKTNLIKAEIFKISVSNALGHGDEQSYRETYRGAEVEIDLHKRVRLEVAVNEPYIEKTVNAIIEGARSPSDSSQPDDESGGGAVGDCKIFIIKLDDVVRIRNGERGDAAIG